MTKFTQEEYSKAANGTLSHTEWNKAATNINDLIDAAGNGSSVIAVTQDQEDVDKKIITIDNVFVGELTAKGDKGTNVNLAGDNNIKNL